MPDHGNPITPEARAELRRLHAAATPGEWRIHDNPKRWILLPTDTEGDPNRDANAAFVAAAHNDLPALLDAIDAAEARVAELEVSPPTVKEVSETLLTHDAVMKRLGAAEWLVQAHSNAFEAGAKTFMADLPWLLEEAARLREKK